MPQLDATFFPPQLVWLALTFAALWFLMAWVALPRIGQVIEQRQKRIDGDLDRATKLKAEIDVVIQAYERALADARTQASATLAQTQERLAKIAADRQREANAALAAQTSAAEARISAAKSAALANVRAIATEVATAAAGRLLGGPADDAVIAAAVDAALRQRG